MGAPALELDGRRGGMGIVGTAGITEPFKFVWPAGTTLTTVRMLTGGTLDDNPADDTGTTPVDATSIDGTTAFISLAVPTMAQGQLAIRLEVNGEIVAFGYLRPSNLGTRSPTGTIQVRTTTATIVISPKAIGGRTDTIEGGTHVEVDSTDPTTPVVDLTDAAKAGIAAGASAAQPADVVVVADAVIALDESLAVVAKTGTYADLSARPALGTAAATDADEYATAPQGDLAESAVQPADLRAPTVGRGTKPYTGAAGLISYNVDPVGHIRRKATHIESFWTPNGGAAGWDGTIPASFADLAALRAYLVLAKNHKVGTPEWDVICSNGGFVQNAGTGQTGGVALNTHTTSAAGAAAIEFPHILVADIGIATAARWGFTWARNASSAAQAYRGEVGLRVASAGTAHAIGIRATCGTATTVVAYCHNGTSEATVALPTMPQDTAVHFEFVFRATQTWDIYRNGELVHTFGTPQAPFLAILRPFAAITKTAGTGTARSIQVDGFAYDLDLDLAA